MYNMVMDKSKRLVWDILSTPDDIDFKKYRETHGATWLTQKRDILWISDMETEHIISCINMLERAGQEHTQAYSGLTTELNIRYTDKEQWKWKE